MSFISGLDGVLYGWVRRSLRPRLSYQFLPNRLQHGLVCLPGSHGQLNHLVELVLGPIIAEDPHDADRNCFVQTTSKSLAVKCKHEGDVLLTGAIDDSVQRVVQATWSNKHRSTGHGLDADSVDNEVPHLLSQ